MPYAVDIQGSSEKKSKIEIEITRSGAAARVNFSDPDDSESEYFSASDDFDEDELTFRAVDHLRAAPDQFADFLPDDLTTTEIRRDRAIPAVQPALPGGEVPRISEGPSSISFETSRRETPSGRSSPIFDDEFFHRFSDHFFNDTTGVLPNFISAGGLANERAEVVPIACTGIAKAVGQIIGEGISRQAIPSAISAYWPHMQRFTPAAAASPLLLSLYRSGDIRTRLRILVLGIAAVLPCFLPAVATYVVVTQMLCMLDAALSEANWKDRGLAALLACSYALQLPVSSEYARRILEFLDSDYGFVGFIRRISEFQQAFATSDPGIAAALISTAVAYQLRLEKIVTGDCEGQRTDSAYVIDYLTSVSRLRSGMEAAAAAGSDRLVRDLNNHLCRNLFSDTDEHFFFKGMRLPLKNAEVADICRVGTAPVDENADAGAGLGLLAHALSRCDLLYSVHGLDRQLWTPDSAVPPDTLGLMMTCEVIRSYATEVNDPGHAEWTEFLAADFYQEWVGNRLIETPQSDMCAANSNAPTAPLEAFNFAAFPDIPLIAEIDTQIANASFITDTNSSVAALNMPAIPPLKSMAREDAPFVVVASATTIGIAATNFEGGLGGVGNTLSVLVELIFNRRTAGVAVSGIGLGTIIYAILKAQWDWLAVHQQAARTPEAPLLTEQALAQIGSREKDSFAWKFTPWESVYLIEPIVTHMFDNALFERTMAALWSGKTLAVSAYEDSVYANSAYLGLDDYQIDKANTPARYLSSEIRYGKEFSELLNASIGNRTMSEASKFIPILVKIKTYETLRWENIFSRPAEGSIASAVKLETIFSLPLVNDELSPSETDVQKFQRAGLNGTAPLQIDKNCAKGCALAQMLFTGFIENSFSKKGTNFGHNDILEDSRNATSTLDALISGHRAYLYNFRGKASDQTRESKKIELLQYRYAAMYLPMLVVDSQGFLDILAHLKDRLPAPSSAPTGVQVLESRALAVQEAIRKFGLDGDKSRLTNLTINELLVNYPAMIASSEDVLYFISVTEAIFRWIKKGTPFSQLYRQAGNVLKIISDFREDIGEILISRYSRTNGIAGINYLQNLQNNTEIGDDTKYYDQFHIFDTRYLSDVSKLISIDKLSHAGLNPYEILKSRPLRCLELVFIIRPSPRYSAWIWVPSIAMGNIISTGDWKMVGELFFCQIDSDNWIVISTIDGHIFIKKFSDATMQSNVALKKIRNESRYFAQHAIYPNGNPEWYGADLENLVLNLIFGKERPLPKLHYLEAGLALLTNRRRYNKEQESNSLAGTHYLLREIVDSLLESILSKAVDHSKSTLYKKKWWQHITSMLPAFDPIYRLNHDADYVPSFGDITWEVINTALFVYTFELPLFKLMYAETTLVRSSILINASRGFRGTALASRVLAEIGPEVARASFRATTMSVSFLISPWVPIPLDLIGAALYKGVRRVMNGKFTFKRELGGDVVRDPISPIKGDGAEPTLTDGSSQIFRRKSPNGERSYEFSYTEDPEQLLGASNDPQPGRSIDTPGGDTAQGPKGIVWDGNRRTFEGMGPVVLKAQHGVRKIETPFWFVRSGREFETLTPVPSTRPVADTGFEQLQLGRAENIVFSGFGEETGFVSGISPAGKHTDVLVIPSANGGAAAIRINFEDVTAEHPLLISSGPMTESAFLMGISEQERAVFFYHFSGPNLAPGLTGSGDPVINGLYKVHNSLIEDNLQHISIPEDAKISDVHLLAQQFEYSDIAYADPSMRAEFNVVEPNAAVSRQSAIRSESSHAVLSGNSQTINYALLDSDTTFSNAEGHSLYSLSRDAKGNLKISGRSEILGMSKSSGKPPTGPKVPEGAVAEVRQEIDELIKQNEFTRFASFPEDLKPDDLRQLAQVLSLRGYTTKYRLLKNWKSVNLNDARLHILLVVKKGKYNYSVDLGAGVFKNEGIESQIFESEQRWRHLYQRYLSKSVSLFEDFSDFDTFKARVESGPGPSTAYDDVSGADWEVLNRPPWMISDANHMLIDAAETERTIAIEGAESRLPRMDLSPQFAYRWLNTVENENFNKIIRSGGGIDSIEKIESYLRNRNFETVTYATLSYKNIFDDNPAFILAVGVSNNPAIEYVIAPLARQEGRTALYSWNEWLDYRSKGLFFVKKYKNSQLVREDFGSPSTSTGAIGAANFFDETNRSYQALSFDYSYLPDLSAAIKNIELELASIGPEYVSLDLAVEEEKLQTLRAQLSRESYEAPLSLHSDLLVQERLVTQLRKYLTLEGLLPRLGDLRGRVLHELNPSTGRTRQYYDTQHMIGDKSTMSGRFVISYPFIAPTLKLQVYDYLKNRYFPTSDFELIAVPNIGDPMTPEDLNLDYLITNEDVINNLRRYESLYEEINNLASAYVRDGGAARVHDIVTNSRAGLAVAKHMQKTPSGTSSGPMKYFALVKKVDKWKPNPTVYGVCKLVGSSTPSTKIMRIDGIIAHPFSQLRNEKEFQNYVNRHRHSEVWSDSNLKNANILGIGRYMSYHAVKYAIFKTPSIDKLIASTINPRSENIAAAFGMRRTDRIALRGTIDDAGFVSELRTYINKIFRRPPNMPSVAAAPPVVVPSSAINPNFEKVLSGRVTFISSKGPIYLKADRSIRNLPWKFEFARSDSEIQHNAPQSSVALGTTAAHNIQLGRGSDIVSYPKDSRVSYGDFWKGENTELQELDVIQIPNGNDGANGIRISLHELPVSQPVIISSGALSGSTLFVGIKNSEDAVYIYETGKAALGTTWKTDSNGVKEIAQVHKVLTKGMSSLNLPENPTTSDLKGLYDFFDHAFIIHNNPRPSEVLTPIDRKDAYHWAFSYKGEDNEFSIGNSQFLILRDAENKVTIEGFTEAGKIGGSPVGRIEVTADNSIGRHFLDSPPPASAETTRILSDLTTKLETDVKLTPFFKERADSAAATKAVMSSLRKMGRSVKCRIVILWSVPGSIEPRIFYLVIDNTNEIPLAIDIAARGFPSFGSPFYGTEDLWAKKLKDGYPRSFVAYQDFDEIADINDALSGAISPDSSSVGAMNVLNVPKWRIRKLDYPTYPYAPRDTTNVAVTLHIPDRGQPGFEEFDLDPDYSVDVSLKGLSFGTKDDIYKGVYDRKAGFRRKEYYIKSDSRVHPVELDETGTTWKLKIKNKSKPTEEPINVKRKDDGRWVIRKAISSVGPLPIPPDIYATESATFNVLSGGLPNLDINRILWNEDYSARMVDRDAAEIRGKIDKEIEDIGGIDQYEQLTGRKPNDPVEPQDWLSARNIFKLMVETDVAINPTTLEATDFSKFATVLDNLDHEENYLFMVDDKRLDHNYLVAIPAGPEINAYILQSDLGRGVMPELKLKDWLKSRNKDSVSVDDILALMRGDFVNLAENKQRGLLASIFGLNKNPDEVNISRLRKDKGASFVMRTYNPVDFSRNVEKLIAKGMLR